jgi:predicted naringenin-chalcone synthase
MNKRPLAYLHGFRPLEFGVRVAQADGAAWLRRALARVHEGAFGAAQKRADSLYARLGRPGAIAARVSAVSDYAESDWEKMSLFKTADGAPWYRPALEARMALFESETLRLAEAAFPAGEAAPAALVQVSCTGYASPHAVQKIAARRGWSPRILHIGHMGCYASVPAAAAAAALARDDAEDGGAGSAALFVTELPTLHLRPEATADEQVVVNTLFGDGAIRFDAAHAERADALALLGAAETLLPDSEREMTWRLRDSSFEMTLSREVPARIGAEVAGFTARFLKKFGLALSDVAHFAIHPGGPRVIESVLRALGLPEDGSPHSRALLGRRGNMSSATLPHVWGEMLADPAVRPGERILSLAFGPGLTAVANLLEKR